MVLKAPGHAIISALENSVSTYPALEGRFPQVSNIQFTFNPSLPPGERIANPTANVKIGGEYIVLDKHYKLATRDYMARGKDGFDSLLMKSEGGELDEIVSTENGILISMLLRQYFISLKTLGQWSKWGRGMDRHWKGVHKKLHKHQPVVEPQPKAPLVAETPNAVDGPSDGMLKPRPPPVQRTTSTRSATDAKFIDDSDDEEHTQEPDEVLDEVRMQKKQMHIMRQVVNKWRRLAGVSQPQSCDNIREGEFQVDWTRAIAPRVEGRIRIVGTA